jgi:hypothetical protein
MKNFFSILLLCLVFSSCNKSDGGSSAPKKDTAPVVVDPGTPAPDPVPVPTQNPSTGLPNEAYTFDTNVTLINMTAEQEVKFESAQDIIKKVVATEEFRNAVLNHTYNGVKTFVDNRGYSNEKIYQTILEAAEKLIPAKNNTMDMEVELYTESSNVIGYTYGSTKRIWVNTKYFNTNPLTSVASNLFHEWLHKIGYGHAVSYSTSRDYSVPYAIGRIVGSLGKNFD